MFKKSTVVAQETYKKRSTKLPTTEEKSSKSSPHRVRKTTTFKDDSSKTTTHTVKSSKITTHKDKVSKSVSHNDKTSKTTTHKDLSSKPSSDKTSKTSPHKEPPSETSSENASKTTGAHKDPTDKTSTDKHSKTIHRTRSKKVLISSHKTNKKHASGHSGHAATKKVPAPDISPTKEKPKTWKEKNLYSLKLSEKQNEDLKQTFAIFDRDRGTELSLSEMVLINNSMGLDVSNAELQGIMDSVDKDVSKTTTFGEFLEIIAQKVSDVAHRKQLIVDFRRYDVEKEGYIRKEEIRNVVRARDEPLSSAELDAMLTNVDIDDDNRVNYEELARVMTA